MNCRPQPYQGCALPLSYGSISLFRKAALWPLPFLSVKAGAVAGNDEERSKRLAAALRENLKRRKAQAREADKAESPAKP